jgi:GNAT superfamily N-acetyltransferase
MVDQIKIRAAVDSDAEVLSQMICENAEAMLTPYYTGEQWAIFVKHYSVNRMRRKIAGQNVFCAELEGLIVGTVALDKDFVLGFYTRLQYFNRGIGKMLMGYLEKFAIEKGLTEIRLTSSPEGLAFYNKTGWTKIKDVVMEYYGVGFDETLMVKKIG